MKGYRLDLKRFCFTVLEFLHCFGNVSCKLTVLSYFKMMRFDGFTDSDSDDCDNFSLDSLDDCTGEKNHEPQLFREESIVSLQGEVKAMESTATIRSYMSDWEPPSHAKPLEVEDDVLLKLGFQRNSDGGFIKSPRLPFVAKEFNSLRSGKWRKPFTTKKSESQNLTDSMKIGRAFRENVKVSKSEVVSAKVKLPVLGRPKLSYAEQVQQNTVHQQGKDSRSLCGDISQTDPRRRLSEQSFKNTSKKKSQEEYSIKISREPKEECCEKASRGPQKETLRRNSFVQRLIKKGHSTLSKNNRGGSLGKLIVMDMPKELDSENRSSSSRSLSDYTRAELALKGKTYGELVNSRNMFNLKLKSSTFDTTKSIQDGDYRDTKGKAAVELLKTVTDNVHGNENVLRRRSFLR